MRNLYTLALVGLALPCVTTVARAADEKPPALLSSKGCIACHDINTKKVGPAYKDVANKYAGQKDAVDKLTTKVLNGGSGVWGQVAMPPNKAMGVTEADARQLVTWVLSLKDSGAAGSKKK